MFTFWLVSSIVIAIISFFVVVGNVIHAYNDGWASQDGKNAIRWGSMAFILSPTGPFIIPLAAAAGLLWCLYKIVRGVIVFGFVKPVPIDEHTGKPKVKIGSSSYDYF